MSWTSIKLAHAYWRRHRGLLNPPSDMKEVETYILGETPATAKDAACILEVICAYGGDVRCDGLDRIAIKRVQAFLSAGESQAHSTSPRGRGGKGAR
jgi:hypothetical protein